LGGTLPASSQRQGTIIARGPIPTGAAQPANYFLIGFLQVVFFQPTNLLPYTSRYIDSIFPVQNVVCSLLHLLSPGALIFANFRLLAVQFTGKKLNLSTHHPVLLARGYAAQAMYLRIKLHTPLLFW